VTTAAEALGLQAEVMRRYGVGPHYADAYLTYWARARGGEFRSLDEIFARPEPEPMWFDFAMSANWRGEQLAQRLVPLLPAGARRYLDVGCGFGGYLVAFARRGLDVAGIEIDPVRIELSRANLADEGLRDRVQELSVLEGGLAERLGTFDVITCIDVIEHVDDVPTAIVRMTELLRPGGVLVLEIPNAEAVASVARDGHFGLFGITLLDRDDAIAYHRRHFSDPYDVGEYHPLDFYTASFAAVGCSARLLEPDPAAAAAPHQVVRPLLRGLRRYRSEVRSGLPEPLRRLVDRRFAAYVGRVGAGFAMRSLGSRFRRRFDLRYLPEFWTLLVAKPGGSAAPAPRHERR
jgi:2-polyprenyl-3-methyl-5-hydroxy-6-metoxy-1,4-benzoquinol methylase